MPPTEQRSDHAGDPADNTRQRTAFNTTHWSVVRRLGETDPDLALPALEQLCRTYWLPIHTFIRRHRSATHHAAEDLTQGFFQHLLERQTLQRAAQERGRFRSFLLGALQNFLANEWDKQQRVKREGRCEFVSLDDLSAEELFTSLPKVMPPPERWFDHQWANALVHQVLERLRNEYTDEGKADLFGILEPALTQADTTGLYARCSAALHAPEGTARVALHRLRQRFRDLLRSEVARTVGAPEEVDEELRHLLGAIAG